MFTENEMRTVESANAKRGWPEIPDGCPPEVRSRIVEYRAKKLGIAPQDPAVGLLKDRLAAQQQISVAL